MLAALRSTQTLSFNILVFIGIAITGEFTLINSLQLQSYTWPITVNSPVATIVGVVEAVSSSKVSCSITGDAKAQEYFTVGINSCIVTIKKSLAIDQDKTIRYFITVQASENGLPPNNNISTSTLEVAVNRDLNNPDITNLPNTVNINESSLPETIIFTGQARDNDSRSLVVCEIVPSYPVSIYFQINSTRCEVSIRNSVILDNQPAYQVPIQVYDLNWPNNKVTKNLTVTVNRNLNGPVFVGSATANIPNNFPPGNVVLVLSATDADGDSLTFSKVNPNDNASSSFYVDSSTGNIYLIKPLSGQSSYTFQVQVSDRGASSLSAFANVTVTISTYFRITMDTPLSLFNLLENNTTPSVLQTVTATYVGGSSSSVILYELLADGFAKTAFNISNTTGAIAQILPFTDDPVKSLTYSLTVRAYQQNDPTVQAYKTIRINVNRNPNQPSFTASFFSFTIPENQPLGRVFGRISATDADLGKAGEITYDISQLYNTPIRSYIFFYVNQYTGELSLAQSLFYESGPSVYTFPVGVKDNGVPQYSATATCSVTVLRNINPPIFATNVTYSITINEDFPVGGALLDLNATDADNQPVSYSIVKTNINDLYFNITSTTGIIALAESLLRAPISVFTLTVIASDNQPSVRTAEAYVTINVLRNPNAPNFLQSLWLKNISEYQEVNVPILTVVATDQDSPNSDNGKVYYSIINQTAISPTPTVGFKTDYFTIGSTSGQIFLSKALTTTESADEYEIYLRAQDGAVTPRSNVSRVVIKITRDLFRPVFTSDNFTASISETKDINSNIISVPAVDNDIYEDQNKGTPNAQVIYELRDFLDSDKQSRFFGITENGVIYKKQATTGDQGSETFSFQVVASDKNWKKNMFSVANVSITVNYDGSASEKLGFMQPVYLVAVKENAEVSDVNQILYMKVENQGNNQVVCTIDGSSDKFVARAVDNEKNCAIYLISQLDRETRDKYDFNVTVKSKALTETGRKKRQTMFKYNSWISTRVVIEVDDVNNNAPQWVFIPYPKNTSDPPEGTRRTFIAAVDYSSPPDTVAIQLKAIDPDSGLNGEVRYGLDIPAINSPPFRIDAVSGDLLINELPPEDRVSRVVPYHMIAVAYDLSVESGGSKNAKAECYVNLIRDDNRFVMVINKKSYLEVIRLKENYRLALQEASNLVILIERIEAKRFTADSYLQIDLTATEITFVAALPRENYQLINNSDAAADSLFTSMNSLSKIRAAFSALLNTNIEAIRPSYGKNIIVRNVLTKSYIWWMDDPWAALIALAAIIILLCIVGIVVITFTYARYIHYISKYREFLNLPPKRKDYEIQTLHMIVPPDDDISVYNQGKMKFDFTEAKEATHGMPVAYKSWKPALRNNSKQDKLTML